MTTAPPESDLVATVPSATGAASGRVAAYLRAAILDGTIAPGDRIRQEDVAERFGASRLPVREALRMLEADGLIEHEPHKGARVPRLSRHEVAVVYQMRERLEPLALSESIPHLSADDLDRLRELETAIEADTDSGAFLALDREFHLLTYSGCGIVPLTSMVTRLWNSTQHYRRAFVSLSGQSRMWVVHAEHRLLLDAIERRDTVDAERYLSGHIRRTRIELERHPEVFDEEAR
jgi:DNA-binding GntR family transcriptional regulator